MYYTPKIDDPAKGLEQICDSASKFNSDRFIYALEYKNWDVRRLEHMCVEVASYREKLGAEYNRLVDFARTFNREFATANNQCYSSALTMLRKLRSGISETKRLFKKFCPRARKEVIYHAIGNQPVSAYDYSYISADSYQLPLFSFDAYPECVSRLHNEMTEFFMLMVRCMQLCREVMKEEANIKKDNKYCKYLFDEFKGKLMPEIADIISLIPHDADELSEAHNPAIASRYKYETDEAWASVGFHNYSRTDVKKLVIRQVLDDEQGSDITAMEKLLFGNDEETVRKYRHIIKHFDELIPASYHRNNLPAKYIQMFFQFVKIPYKLESDAVDYFNETYLSSPDHRFVTVTYQAINGHKKSVLEDKNGDFKAFVEKLRQHFYGENHLNLDANF
ncbi:MAG: hypothetical protein II975_08195 [Bacteroidales bacterium]|nr:hypothetical protein [Bacteroidales bacterium]MBQ6742089.1 hypothetical protein [Bacteroidales bacterium]